MVIPLPPWGTGWRRRRMPFVILVERNRCRSLFSRITVKTVHICQCFSEVWSELHRCISAWFVQWDIPVFLISLVLLRGWTIGVVFLCQFIHSDALLLGPTNFELRITIFKVFFWKRSWIPSNFCLRHLLRSVGHEMLLLCAGFALPSTVWSTLLVDVVLDWESIQSPLVKMTAGSTFFQEMSTSAIDNSLIPIKEAFWALHFWNCFAWLKQLYIAHFTNHLLWFVTDWVVGVVLLQIGLKCVSMRMTLANTEVFCLFHNCMWQSRHSEVNVYFLALCEQTDGLSTLHKSLRLIWSASTFSSASLSLSERSTDTGTQLFTSLPVLNNWIYGLWLGLLGAFTMSSNFWTQFFHPIVFKGNLRRKSRWRMFFLVYDFSSSHHDSLRDTKSWECVVKDDLVRSCLIEIKSFLLSRFYVDPIHRVWCFFHTFCLYQARRGASRSILFG